jgi:hypothetical protein
MTHHLKTLKNTQAGIALLMTIIVLGVVLSVTLAIVELSLQHLSLSVDSRDSEIAFHAANAGLECARYYKRHSSSTFETGGPNVPQTCFGTNSPKFVRFGAGGAEGVATSSGARGAAYRYQASILSGASRCSVIDMVIMVVEASSTKDMTLTAPDGNLDLRNVFPGYSAS